MLEKAGAGSGANAWASLALDLAVLDSCDLTLLLFAALGRSKRSIRFCDRSCHLGTEGQKRFCGDMFKISTLNHLRDGDPPVFKGVYVFGYLSMFPRSVGIDHY